VRSEGRNQLVRLEAERLQKTELAEVRVPLLVRPFYHLWRRALDQIEVVRLDLPVRRLPVAFEGVRACQLSDLHIDRDEDLERLERAVSLVNQERPALVFLTGDYFSGPATMRRYLPEVARVLSWLNPFLAAFAIPGNHDNWSCFALISAELARIGIVPLCNQSRRISYRGESVVIVGIDDLTTRRADPNGAFRGVRAEDCTLVLAHNPDTVLYLRHRQPGVVLCGHTHGGAIRLPIIGSPIRWILKLGANYYAGLNRYDTFYVYTNRGLGTFCVRLRFNCRPEVSSFSLTRFDDLQSGAR